jgi:hypothetical protein
MTVYFVQKGRVHTFPESSECPGRYLGEQLHASIGNEHPCCCHCFPMVCDDDD